VADLLRGRLGCELCHKPRSNSRHSCFQWIVLNQPSDLESASVGVSISLQADETLSVGGVGNSPKLFRRVLGLTWPVFVENLLQTMVGVVDIFMVSFLGTVAVAGVGASLPLVFVIFSAISAVGTGGTVLVAHRIGARDFKAARKAAKQSILLGILLSIMITAVGVSLAGPIVGLFRLEERVFEIGSEYFSITMATSLGLVMLFIGGAVLRGAGDTRTPMLAGLATNVINIVLAYVLIFGKFGFPEVGAAGSAWAAAIGRLVGCAGLFFMMWRMTGSFTIRGFSHWMLDRAMSARLLRIGLPAALEQMLGAITMLIFSAMVIRLGTNAFAAQRITLQVLMLGWMSGFAFSIAATTLVGQALGGSRYAEAARVAWVAVIAAGISMLVFTAACIAWATPIAAMFSSSVEVVELTSSSIRIMSLSLPCFAMVIVLQGALRGAGDTRFPMYVNGISQLFFSLPLAWVAGYSLMLGLPGMYGAFVLDAFLRLVPTYLRFRSDRWMAIKP